jgi:ATP-binding cassette subfamily C protein
MVSYNRLNEILNYRQQTNGNEILNNLDTITINKMSFSYGDNFLFNNFSAEFKKGKIYALNGENGSGKSTLINIIIGLYADEISGEIKYNDKFIKQIDMIELRKKFIGISEQEPILLTDTIKFNLTLDDNVPFDEKLFKDLCNNFNIEEFVKSLTNDLDTEINEKSSNLSGGEKQKISLMRAILRNPHVLILDEPTSALDIDSKIRLKTYLQSIRDEKIIIISTHSKEILEICDEVINLGSAKKW